MEFSLNMSNNSKGLDEFSLNMRNNPLGLDEFSLDMRNNPLGLDEFSLDMRNNPLGLDEYDQLYNTLTDIPKALTITIFEYTYAKCNDCGKCIDKKYLCKNCNTIRCDFCAFVNMRTNYCRNCFLQNIKKRKDSTISSFICIANNCFLIAEYGYRDIVCYCEDHVINKYRYRLYTIFK